MLRRNVINPAVAEVHVLVGEAAPVRSFLKRLPWHERAGCKLHLIETGTRPKFVDYMRQVSGPLLGRTVVFTNQDVFLADGPWATLPAALPPRTLRATLHMKMHTYAFDARSSSPPTSFTLTLTLTLHTHTQFESPEIVTDCD